MLLLECHYSYNTRSTTRENDIAPVGLHTRKQICKARALVLVLIHSIRHTHVYAYVTVFRVWPTMEFFTHQKFPYPFTKVPPPFSHRVLVDCLLKFSWNHWNFSNLFRKDSKSGKDSFIPDLCWIDTNSYNGFSFFLNPLFLVLPINSSSFLWGAYKTSVFFYVAYLISSLCVYINRHFLLPLRTNFPFFRSKDLC